MNDALIPLQTNASIVTCEQHSSGMVVANAYTAKGNTRPDLLSEVSNVIFIFFFLCDVYTHK
jgi:hypothetical protein